tara:strand:- start:4237 stop:4953 length:717 start_codon:yes stop_codon:yes gene_type:complete
MNTRNKLLASVGVVSLVALLGIGFYAVNSAESIEAIPSRVVPAGPCKEYLQPYLSSPFWESNRQEFGGSGFPETREAQDYYWENIWSAYEALARRKGVPVSVRWNVDALSCSGLPEEGRTTGVPAETLYETEQIVTLLAIAAALTALGVAATLIWSRPKDDEPVATVSSPTPGANRPERPSPATPVEQVPTPAPTVETVASSATDPASALRQLKALHEEGILTDDEYETKRKALTDQL